MAAMDIPRMAWPFRRGLDGKVALVEQDTTEHIMSCELAIIQCPVGFREERPEFGWPMPMFKNVPVDTGGLVAALEQFEPRGDADVTVHANSINAAIQCMRVEVRTLNG